MAQSNVEFFEKAVESEPDNQMARYSLAMEYRKEGMLGESLAAFDELIRLDESYIPAYQMAGQVAVDLDDADRAKAILTAGIAAAEKARNKHAASKMTELLDTLPSG